MPLITVDTTVTSTFSSSTFSSSTFSSSTSLQETSDLSLSLNVAPTMTDTIEQNHQNVTIASLSHSFPPHLSGKVSIEIQKDPDPQSDTINTQSKDNLSSETLSRESMLSEKIVSASPIEQEEESSIDRHSQDNVNHIESSFNGISNDSVVVLSNNITENNTSLHVPIHTQSILSSNHHPSVNSIQTTFSSFAHDTTISKESLLINTSISALATPTVSIHGIPSLSSSSLSSSSLKTTIISEGNTISNPSVGLKNGSIEVVSMPFSKETFNVSNSTSQTATPEATIVSFSISSWRNASRKIIQHINQNLHQKRSRNILSQNVLSNINQSADFVYFNHLSPLASLIRHSETRLTAARRCLATPFLLLPRSVILSKSCPISRKQLSSKDDKVVSLIKDEALSSIIILESNREINSSSELESLSVHVLDNGQGMSLEEMMAEVEELNDMVLGLDVLTFNRWSFFQQTLMLLSMRPSVHLSWTTRTISQPELETELIMDTFALTLNFTRRRRRISHTDSSDSLNDLRSLDSSDSLSHGNEVTLTIGNEDINEFFSFISPNAAFQKSPTELFIGNTTLIVNSLAKLSNRFAFPLYLKIENEQTFISNDPPLLVNPKAPLWIQRMVSKEDSISKEDIYTFFKDDDHLNQDHQNSIHFTHSAHFSLSLSNDYFVDAFLAVPSHHQNEGHLSLYANRAFIARIPTRTVLPSWLSFLDGVLDINSNNNRSVSAIPERDWVTPSFWHPIRTNQSFSWVLAETFLSTLSSKESQPLPKAIENQLLSAATAAEIISLVENRTSTSLLHSLASLVQFPVVIMAPNSTTEIMTNDDSFLCPSRQIVYLPLSFFFYQSINSSNNDNDKKLVPAMAPLVSIPKTDSMSIISMLAMSPSLETVLERHGEKVILIPDSRYQRLFDIYSKEHPFFKVKYLQYSTNETQSQKMNEFLQILRSSLNLDYPPYGILQGVVVSDKLTRSIFTLSKSLPIEHPMNERQKHRASFVLEVNDKHSFILSVAHIYTTSESSLVRDKVIQLTKLLIDWGILRSQIAFKTFVTDDNDAVGGGGGGYLLEENQWVSLLERQSKELIGILQCESKNHVMTLELTRKMELLEQQHKKKSNELGTLLDSSALDLELCRKQIEKEHLERRHHLDKENSMDNSIDKSMDNSIENALEKQWLIEKKALEDMSKIDCQAQIDSLMIKQEQLLKHESHMNEEKRRKLTERLFQLEEELDICYQTLEEITSNASFFRFVHRKRIHSERFLFFDE